MLQEFIEHFVADYIFHVVCVLFILVNYKTLKFFVEITLDYATWDKIFFLAYITSYNSMNLFS